LDGPASDATFHEIENLLLTPALHARLMTNTLKTMATSGLNAAGELLALNLAAALHASRALIIPPYWTHRTSPLQRYIKGILEYIKTLPDLSELIVETTLQWFVEKTSVHYHELTPLMLPPSTTPAPASGPPTPAPQPTYASRLASPTPAEARNLKTPRPVRTPSTKGPTTTASRRTDQIPSKAIVIRNLHILTHHRPTLDPKTHQVKQPDKKTFLKYYKLAGIPPSMIETIRHSYITNKKFDIRIFFHTTEAAQSVHDIARKEVSGAQQKSMINPPASVYVNVFYFTEDTARRDAYYATKSVKQGVTIDERLAALEIAEKLDQASKTASKSLHQARSHAKKVHTAAANHPTDKALADAAASATHLTATAEEAAAQATTATAAKEVAAATAAAEIAKEAANAAKVIVTALPTMTPRSKPTQVDPALPPSLPPIPPADQNAMEVTEPTGASLATSSSSSNSATIAPAPTPQDPTSDMEEVSTPLAPPPPPTSTKRPPPPSPPRLLTNMEEGVGREEDDLDRAARGIRPPQQRRKTTATSSSSSTSLSAKANAFRPSRSLSPSSR
jgi:hypothetical protein